MSDSIAYPAPDLSSLTPPESAFERERQAFRKLLPELRAKYNGQYVAIKNGPVIASGLEEVPVALEAYSRVGYGPLYLGFVSDFPCSPARLPSARRPPGQDADLNEPLSI